MREKKPPADAPGEATGRTSIVSSPKSPPPIAPTAAPTPAPPKINRMRLLPGASYRERLPGGTILEAIALSGGSFLMGSTTEDVERVTRLETWFERWEVQQWLRREMPQHRVAVPGFLMGKTPITQEQWRAVMETNPSDFSDPSRPVENVSWWEAIEFCDRKIENYGQTLSPSERSRVGICLPRRHSNPLFF